MSASVLAPLNCSHPDVLVPLANPGTPGYYNSNVLDHVCVSNADLERGFLMCFEPTIRQTHCTCPSDTVYELALLQSGSPDTGPMLNKLKVFKYT